MKNKELSLEEAVSQGAKSAYNKYLERERKESLNRRSWSEIFREHQKRLENDKVKRLFTPGY